MRADAADRRKDESLAAKLKLQALDDERLRRLRRERKRRAKAAAAQKEMEESLAKLQYQAMLREQEVRRQKHEAVCECGGKWMRGFWRGVAGCTRNWRAGSRTLW